MHTNELLQSICDDIELITGIKTVIYDENRTIIHTQPDMMCEFCKEVRRSGSLTEKCLACDTYGFTKSAQAHDIFIYNCHMGLTEAVAPVLENGRIVGYLMLGQILRKGDRERVKAHVESIGHEGNTTALLAHLDAMNETDELHLRATARILAMSAAYVRVYELLTKQKNAITYKIESYIFESIANQDLCAKSICAALGLSRTALYNACRAGFGVGVSTYIQQQRAARAIPLLRTTSHSLLRIAEMVGLNSTTRLNRLLITQSGMSAKHIRQQTKTN